MPKITQDLIINVLTFIIQFSNVMINIINNFKNYEIKGELKHG